MEKQAEHRKRGRCGMKKRILIVAGHGQGDPGAVSIWGQEADLTRELAQMIYDRIDTETISKELYDMEKDCYQQTKNGTGPNYRDYDFILEIHFNAKVKKDENGDGKFTGTGGYLHTYADSKLAEEILNAIVNLGFKNWCLCRSEELCNCNAAWRAGTPYFLLETAFLDDGDDMNFYLNQKTKVADVVVDVLNKRLGKKKEEPENLLYCVQCGAFKNKENAETLKKQLETAGFEAILFTK